MALFRRSRRQRTADGAKGARRETRTAQATTPLLERLQEIAAGAASPEEALEPALRAIVESTAASAGALCLFDQRQNVLRLTAEADLSDEGCRRLRTVRRGDPSCWDIPLHGVVNRRAYLIENASENRYVPPLIARTGSTMRTIACIPVYSGVSALASIVLVTVAPRAFTERDITALWKPLRELAQMIEAVRRQAAPTPAAEASTPAPSFDLLALTTERDRLRTELAGRSAEFQRLTTQLASSREEQARITAALEAAVAARADIARELERVRTESEDTGTLAQALADAERERQRLVAALEAAAEEAAARESRALAQARQEAEMLVAAREAEWDAARRTQSEQLAVAGRLAEERATEITRLTARITELESGAWADRGRDHAREGELARLTAALEAAAKRETDLRARLAAREAERIGDAELTALRETLDVAEAGRARAEDRVANLDAELATARTMLEEAQGALATARDEVAELRDAERQAQATAERAQGALVQAQGVEAEVRSRLDVAERVLAEVRAERDRAHEEARGQQDGLARAEARLEAIAAERDQLREALTRSEGECTRLRAALDAAQNEDARVETLLAEERAEKTRIANRLAEAEGAIARLEAITTEQRSELAEREAEIVRITAEHAALLAERDRLLLERPETQPAVTLDSADLEAAALVAPDAPATVTRAEGGVTVINVHDTDGGFEPTGAPVVVVFDADPAWTRVGIAGHDVAVLRPGASAVSRVAALAPSRIVANLAAPGAMTSLMALRASGSTVRIWGCIADPDGDRAIALSAIEPVVGPIDPDAVIAALGPYANRDGRIVTTGADVDALMSLRQALSRRKASVSMAWDAKQAREMLGVVRPHAVVIDMSMPKRDGCAIVAALATLDPIPLAILVTNAGDPAHDFAALLADPPREIAVVPLATVAAKFGTRGEEALPGLGNQRAAVKAANADHGTRWLG